jgi:TetR/AcrR family fatty acid metabolism transcriptional regulator
MGKKQSAHAAPPGAVETPEAEGCHCRHKKRQKILEAAARAFAHEDFHKVSTERIAAAAGVGKGTLFRYFPSKEELFVATLVYGAEVASAEMDRALAGLTEPLERLETVCEHLVGFYRGNDHLFHLVHHHKTLRDQAAHDVYHEKQNALRGRVAEMIRAGQAAGRFRDLDAEIAGRLLFGMLRTAMRSPQLRDRSPHEIAGIILDLFIRGAANREAPAAGEAPPG